jgi:hypothetical protein
VDDVTVFVGDRAGEPSFQRFLLDVGDRRLLDERLRDAQTLDVEGPRLQPAQREYAAAALTVRCLACGAFYGRGAARALGQVGESCCPRCSYLGWAEV